MTRRISFLLLSAVLLLTFLTGCEHFTPDDGTESRPPVTLPSEEGTVPTGGPEATDGAEPSEENHGFTVFPEGDYLADPMFDTDEYLPDYDVDLSSIHRLSTGDNFCGTETTVYYIRNGHQADSPRLITYMDKATGVSLPLCGKPECMHDDENCNAYVFSPAGLSVYNGKLYWQDSGQVMRMNLDGTEREKLRNCAVSVSSQCIAFHRGYVYYTTESNDAENGVAGYRLKIYASSLDGGSFVLLDRFVEGGVNCLLKPVGREVYIMLNMALQKKGGGEDDLQDRVELLRWDTKTRQGELLYSADAPEGAVYSRYSFRPIPGDGIYFDLCGEPRDFRQIVYKYSFETGEAEPFMELYKGPEDYFTAPFFTRDYIIVEHGGTGDTLFYRDMLLYTYEGEMVKRLTPGDAYYFQIFYGMDEENLYGMCTIIEEDKWLEVFFAAPLDGGEGIIIDQY